MRADREEIVTVKAGALAQVALLIEAMRPRQWIKNLLIFAGVFYAGKIRSAGALEQSIAAFALFCAITGAIYIFND
ncbi:decaprenyl-phosphate phosphoribosyltransferase, partial [Candidatus Sumerlaeota bacterium]|nr:decaprenyl-phosphate phosphoribosyltransferase [Candidatus Sumerlaeota bacterium]